MEETYSLSAAEEAAALWQLALFFFQMSRKNHPWPALALYAKELVLRANSAIPWSKPPQQESVATLAARWMGELRLPAAYPLASLYPQMQRGPRVLGEGDVLANAKMGKMSARVEMERWG
jgi:hypothetical protein